ncbi:MAG: bifunctional diaminohydroxyphosphoribosylaminopyrimidine deaminase/5-amino-6-(5-phosphoribosylamino)uracil reductase RibD [Betaproteobacteria bacterium]
MDEQTAMILALDLANRGLYTTTPNPRVGCVLLKQGQLVGQGWHERAGQAHAEVNALREAGQQARGATAYVSLEPCSHQGKTGPCCEALIQAGVVKVVVAMQDPNPLVAGQGLQRLREAGIEVEVGLMNAQAQALNLGFISRMRRARPWVRVKVAASLDGKTALLNGQSQWITGPEARADTHHWRARACAILTGIGTVNADDPQLNVRAVNTTRQPFRVVVDSHLRILPKAQLLAEGTWVVSAIQDAVKMKTLEARGAKVCCIPNKHGQVDLEGLMIHLAAAGGVNELHVEAGAQLNGALLAAGLIDELLIYWAPTVIGHKAQGMFDFPELTVLSNQHRFKRVEFSAVGEDIRIVLRRAAV